MVVSLVVQLLNNPIKIFDHFDKLAEIELLYFIEYSAHFFSLQRMLK
jgi:hypothetical protein